MSDEIASVDGNAVEHWDTLQIVGDPKNSAPLIAPSIPRANTNGMFRVGKSAHGRFNAVHLMEKYSGAEIQHAERS